MIYETAIVADAGLSDDAVEKLKNTVQGVISESNGEVLVNDDWGVRTFAQPTDRGVAKGRYVYLMYKANSSVNAELERRFGINENVLKYLIVKMGEDKHQENIVKGYKAPSFSSSAGSKEISDVDKDRKLFARKKSCWFSAKKERPDWKEPSSYTWLVNEFGKISPARVTGLSAKFQRQATRAIKQGRTIGFISHLSNRVAQ